MRFCLVLDITENKLPIEYRKIILSYTKNALSKCNNGKYYDTYFKDVVQKDYCFSVVLPKARFLKEEIILEGNEIKILFSTDDKNKSGLILYSAFIGQKNKVFKLPNGNSMILKSIKNEKSDEITNNKVIFKTTVGSCLCIREHIREGNKDNYVVYNDNDFREKFKEVVTYQLKGAGFTSEVATNIKINPIQCKKVIVKHYSRYIDTSVGMFQLEGDREALQYLYNTGIGSRKSSGFGMIDLITQDLL